MRIQLVLGWRRRFAMVGAHVLLVPLLVAENGVALAQVGQVSEIAVASDGVLALAYSSDGTQLAGGSFDATVKIWNADTGESERTLVGHTRIVRSVAFAPHGSVLASGSDDKTTILWDSKTGKRIKTLDGFTRDVFALKFSPEGNTLWTASGDLVAWDVATGNRIATIPLNCLFVNSIDISPDGKIVVVTQLSDDKSMSAKLIDIESRKVLRSIGGNEFGVYSTCLLSDGKHMAGTCFNKTDGPSIRVWDIATGNEQKRFAPEFNEIWAIDLSPDANLIATGGEGPVVETVAPSGKRLLSALTIWDLKTGHAKSARLGPLGRLSALCFSPDNRRIAYCDSATVGVFAIDSGDQVWSGDYGTH